MHQFATPAPIELRIRNGSGRVDVTTEANLTTSLVNLTGLDEAGVRAAESATVTHHGNVIHVEIPERPHRLGRSPQVLVTAHVPSDSTADVTVGSADVTIGDGCRAIRVTAGSGDLRIGRVDGDADIRSGSGDISISHVGAMLRVSTGSGDVDLGRGGAHTSITTGSGVVRIGQAGASTITKTGSGDVAISALDGQLDAKSGSGDTRVDVASQGSIRVRTASGDVAVGVAAGTAAWLDLSSISGHIDQQLAARHLPGEHQPRLAITVSTVSGDIAIRRN